MEKREIIIAVAVNVLGGIGAWLFTAKWEYAVLVLIICGGVLISTFVIGNFRNVGIMTWASQRGYMKDFRKSLDEASTSISFLASWGGSMPSLSPNIEKTFQNMAQSGCVFRFLLLMPGSEGEIKRRETRGSWVLGQPETDIRWLLHVKQSLGVLGKNFKVALYSDEPLWAIVIIDDKKAIVGFYGTGHGRDNPGIVVERLKNKPSFFQPFKQVYDRLWNESLELNSIKEFELLMQQKQTRTSKNCVFAIYGPSGAGKTTLCQELVRRKVGLPSITYTTRSPRKNEEQLNQYIYVSESQFLEMLQEGKFLGSTKFCGEWYGITTQMVFEIIEHENALVLDTVIPPRILKERLGNQVIIIFVTTNSQTELKRRLANRGMPIEEIGTRMEIALHMINEAQNCDYIFYNNGDLVAEYDRMQKMIELMKQYYASGMSNSPQELQVHQSKNVLTQRKGVFDE
jgi:guanylate kinase